MNTAYTCSIQLANVTLGFCETRPMIVGFLHPGAMGASLAAACVADRVWCGEARSVETRRRAEQAGIREVASLAGMAAQCDVIVSVCPPGSAVAQADAVAATGFDGVYADVNAIAPATARSIGSMFDRFVDGGVIGPPVERPGTTRLYLAGAESAAVGRLWAGSALDVRALDGPIGSASAVKASFAAWNKGTQALLLAIRALAAAEGVDGALMDEWAISFPDLAIRSDRAAASSAPKAWRFEGEMLELAEAFVSNDLPAGFMQAAAEVFARLADCKGAPAPDLASVVELLRRTPAR